MIAAISRGLLSGILIAPGGSGLNNAMGETLTKDPSPYSAGRYGRPKNSTISIMQVASLEFPYEQYGTLSFEKSSSVFSNQAAYESCLRPTFSVRSGLTLSRQSNLVTTPACPFSAAYERGVQQ